MCSGIFTSSKLSKCLFGFHAAFNLEMSPYFLRSHFTHSPFAYGIRYGTLTTRRSYPEFISDDDVKGFFAFENAKNDFAGLGVVYSIDGPGSVTLTYPEAYSKETVKAELDKLVNDLIAYITAVPEAVPEPEVIEEPVQEPELAADEPTIEEAPAEEPVIEEPVQEISEDQESSVSEEPEAIPEAEPEPVPEVVEDVPVEEPIVAPEEPSGPVQEPVIEEPKAEGVPAEAAPETVGAEGQANIETSETQESGEEVLGEDIYTDYSPEAVVRRAAWNKGLRCRRGYGEFNIPVAFVKGKVAVYVDSEEPDTTHDAELRDMGWTVLRYDASTVTDGKAQGDEIAAAVKANMRSAKAAAKKKSKK